MLFGAITLLAVVSAVLTTVCSGSFGSLAWLWVLPTSFLGSWLGLLILAALFFVVLSCFVDQKKPQEKDSAFYRGVIKLYVPLILRLARANIQTAGLEKIPNDGRFLLVCNHQSEADPAILIHYFRDSQLSFISKRENATMPVVGNMMHKIRCLMLNRDNDRDGLRVILECIRRLKADECSIAVFPEGGIKGYAKLHPFRPGVFKMAQKAEVPIVVCTLAGTQDVFKKLKKLQRIDVTLHVLDVIPAAELKGVNTTQIAGRVFDLMSDDLGPDWRLPENA